MKESRGRKYGRERSRSKKEYGRERERDGEKMDREGVKIEEER